MNVCYNYHDQLLNLILMIIISYNNVIIIIHPDSPSLTIAVKSTESLAAETA